MKRILIGLVAAVIIAASCFSGFQFYTQRRIAGEVETAFEQVRASGAKASHGKVSFDLWSRTVVIADIASESATQPPVSVKIARIVASGVAQPDAARFSASSIEASDVEIGAGIAGPAAGQTIYKMPRVVLKDYSGRASLQRPPASATMIDVYRSVLEQFAAVSASSISIPTITGIINFGPTMSGDYTYSGTALRDIKDGKVTTMQTERAAFTVNIEQAGKSDKMTGEIANLVAHDFDTAAAAAILDPKNAGDDRYYRLYGQTTTGAYTATSTLGLRMHIDEMSVDDVGVRPSRLQVPALLAMIPQAGAAPPTPDQARELINKMATLYEGIRIGNVEMRGLSVDTPQGPFKLSAMRFNLENGKIGEFAFEGFDTQSRNGPIKVGRFALKSLDLAGLLRMSAQFSNPSQMPSLEMEYALLALLEGVELKGLVAPFKNTGKRINIDNVDLNWGQFVGPIPSRVRLTAKMATPVDPTDPRQLLFFKAGIDTLALDLDFGTAWTEEPRTFVLEPATIELGGLLKATARVSFANVPRGVFSLDPVQGASMAAQIEAGTLELTLRDLGGVDAAVVQYARGLNISRDAARHAMVDNIRTNGEQIAGSNPDVVSVVEALTRFVGNPGQTLVIKLTPLGKVPVLQLIELLKTEPIVALAQFRIEASTDL